MIMAFMNSGGFVFPVNSIFNGMGDSYVNECVPDTVGVGNRVPVTVRVRVAQPVTQSISQPGTNRLQVTVQQNLSLFVPVQQGVTNPVQQHQTINQQQEIPVAEIQPVNQALRDFASNNVGTGVGVTVPVPVIVPQQVGSQVKEIAQQTSQAIDSLGVEVATDIVTRQDLADEAIRGAASGIDEAAMLAQKIKYGGLSPAQIQQAFQRAGASFESVRDIQSSLFGSVDDVAQAIRNSGVVTAANNVISSVTNNVAARACGI